ncbi:hypothetical protein OM318_18485 [Escherichia albertii]|nr:hypothetical protein [Escherichia albertii]EHW5675716.1 hypothetical protein [Escherichia albertii]MCU7297459.1 hypothetical protein [Escherichia albertii]MCZ8925736.1 hypothetical protein [Escherichia albertii]MCZ9139497.1 hypothetical protein [Escherichia albertii]MCZ9154275.1 hypothetical protein [Escherichia albertii]
MKNTTCEFTSPNEGYSGDELPEIEQIVEQWHKKAALCCGSRYSAAV